MPKIVDKEEKKRDIISAAIAVFARNGFHATKMEEVARAATIAKGTIYTYFSTKEDLFLAAYDYWMNNLEECIRKHVAAADDLLSKTDAVRKAAVQYYKEHSSEAPILLEFWAHALRSNNPAFLARIQTTRTFLATLGQEISEGLVQHGVFTDVHTHSFARLEAAISDGIFLDWVLSGQSFSLEEAYKFRQAIIGVGLLSDEGRLFTGEKAQEKLRSGFAGGEAISPPTE